MRLLSSRSHSYHDALARLRPDALACAARITCAPVLPTGRATIEVGVDRKIAGNKGDLATPTDPCPWEGDGQCDEDEICAPGTDESDCRLGE